MPFLFAKTIVLEVPKIFSKLILISVSAFSIFPSGSWRSSLSVCHRTNCSIRYTNCYRRTCTAWNWSVYILNEAKSFTLIHKLIGVGVNMLAQMMCIGPVYCRSRRGQCCLIVFRSGTVGCPSRC